jgi:hypothetical protein
MKSSNHTLSLHRPTSKSSSTTNFPWLISAFQSNSVNCVVAPHVFKMIHRHWPPTESTSRVRYLASILARWLEQQKINHVTATQPAHWRTDRCLARSYNISPIVARAYRGMFIEPLPSNALSKSVAIFMIHVNTVTWGYMTVDGVWIGDSIYWPLIHTTRNYK